MEFQSTVGYEERTMLGRGHFTLSKEPWCFGCFGIVILITRHIHTYTDSEKDEKRRRAKSG